jgi:hypothetical protein
MEAASLQPKLAVSAPAASSESVWEALTNIGRILFVLAARNRGRKRLIDLLGRWSHRQHSRASACPATSPREMRGC